MSKRVVKTALGISTAAAVGAGCYAYAYPNELNKLIDTYKFFITPQQPELPKKLVESKPLKAIEIKRPINDESLKNFEYTKSDLEKVAASGQSEKAAVTYDSLASNATDAKLNTANSLKPVDLKQSSNLEPLPAREADAKLKAAETNILKALETAQSVIREVTDAKYKTIQAIKEHGKELKRAVDAGSQGNWSVVNKALEHSEIASKTDIQLEAASRDAIDVLHKTISEAKLLPQSKLSSLVLMASETASKCSHQLDELNHLIKKASNERRIFNQYKDLIEASRRHFADELKSIVPGMDSSIKTGELTKDELDALLSHAYLRINQFRHQLIEQQVREEQNIANAIEDQQKADAAIAEAQLDLELRRVRENINYDVEKKVLEERKVWETELEARLQRAAAAHAQHLEDIVRMQKQLHDIENAKLVETALTKERGKHSKDVELAMAKLNGIEHALHSRIAMDNENRRAKQYWLACQNLVQSIVYGTKAGSTVEARKKPLAAELNIIKEACINDDFVQFIINLFPKTAVESGVFTEQDLKNRFNKLYKLGRRTAKIDENGGGFMKYVLSYVQSLLMAEVPRSYTPDDKINIAVPVDVYDVLGRAKYFAEKGDFASAIRIVQLLDGQPGRLARDWLVDARTYLETRFLAQLLAAHATVSSIRSTY